MSTGRNPQAPQQPPSCDDGYPADWNRVYDSGKLVSATPPTARISGCRFYDNTFLDENGSQLFWSILQPWDGTDAPPPSPLIAALRDIARGHTDRGSPLAAETARQLARTALVEAGLDWTRVEGADV